MRPLPFSLWPLIAAQIEVCAQAQAAESGSQPHLLLPTAIRKMPPDQGAKFHPWYYAFPDDQAFAPAPQTPFAAKAARRAVEADDALRLATNASAELPYRAPFAVIADQEEHEGRRTPSTPAQWDVVRRALSALAALQKRQWACPSGTSSCASIGYPNLCCGDGETCGTVPDTGLGPVACCPKGTACQGAVSGCADGSAACGSDIGGGCCIPGFVCGGVGCVPSPSPTTTQPPPPSLTTLTTTSTSIISPNDPTPSTVLVTVIITITPAPITSTVTQTQTASSPPTSTPGAGSGAGAGAPFRPTASSAPPPDSSSSIFSHSYSYTFCPTGFYPCLASAGGGCCQTGRDCQTTSCPPPPGVTTTTVVGGNGATVVVVVPAGVSGTGGGGGGGGTSRGQCASGWFLCGSEAGPVPGCCPSGYSCGSVSCSVVTAGGTATVGKELPGHGNGGAGRVNVGRGWGGVVLAVVVFLLA
ncbi:hypothetical protein VTK56DRAFT_2692 [Thermocarpiscus australiensis]